MPTKVKKNYRAMAHSDDLVDTANRVNKLVLRGQTVALVDLDALIRLANDLARELRGNMIPPPDTFDPFLTDAPKQTPIDKMSTVKAPAVEPEPVKQKSGFLGRG